MTWELAMDLPPTPSLTLGTGLCLRNPEDLDLLGCRHAAAAAKLHRLNSFSYASHALHACEAQLESASEPGEGLGSLLGSHPRLESIQAALNIDYYLLLCIFSIIG